MGNTVRTKGNDGAKERDSMGQRFKYHGDENTEGVLSEKNPVIESDADNHFENKTQTQGDYTQNLNERLECQTQYTMMTAKPKTGNNGVEVPIQDV